jgi:GTP-binding protein
MDAVFVKSSNTFRTCPEADLPEFAFIGRSNVGKSSLINMLVNEKNLAKISSKPGKTQLINHFLTYPETIPAPAPEGKNNRRVKLSETYKKSSKSWYLVDLPGYGYARLSKSQRDTFSELIKGYIVSRSNLMCLFVLIDSRLEPQKIDIEFVEFLGEQQIPFVLVFTKADKISDNQVHSNMSMFKREMLKSWEELPHTFVTSVIERKGRTEIISFIETTIKKANKNK